MVFWINRNYMSFFLIFKTSFPQLFSSVLFQNMIRSDFQDIFVWLLKSIFNFFNFFILFWVEISRELSDQVNRQSSNEKFTFFANENHWEEINVIKLCSFCFLKYFFLHDKSTKFGNLCDFQIFILFSFHIYLNLSFFNIILT